MSSKKITDFADGGAFQPNDAILIARGNTNFFIKAAQVPKIPPALLIPQPPSINDFNVALDSADATSSAISDDVFFSLSRTDSGKADSWVTSLRMKAVPGTEWSATATLKLPAISLAPTSFRVGFAIREHASDAIRFFGFDNSLGQTKLAVVPYTDIETATAAVGSMTLSAIDLLTLKISFAAGSYTAAVSGNFGRSFIELVTWTAASTFTADQVGFAVSTQDIVRAGLASCDVVSYSEVVITA